MSLTSIAIATPTTRQILVVPCVGWPLAIVHWQNDVPFEEALVLCSSKAVLGYDGGNHSNYYLLVSCRVVSCRVVSCRVVSCRVVSCRVVSLRQHESDPLRLTTNVAPGTLRDQITYPEHITNSSRDSQLNTLMELVDLTYIVDREGWNATKDWADELSGGEKQRIAMARLFYHRPDFGILVCTTTTSAPRRLSIADSWLVTRRTNAPVP
jgi:ABC-type iron transport system FetAB ATPase subunit